MKGDKNMGLHNMLKSLTRAGEVNGSEFPLGTYINFGTDEGENYMLFTYPNKEEEKITHDMVKCATILAMGVTEIKTAQQAKAFTNNQVGVVQDNVAIMYGAKYLCVLKDGRQAVLTVNLGKTQYMVERVLF